MDDRYDTLVVGAGYAGTVMAERLATEMPKQLAAAGVPEQFVGQFANGGGAIDIQGTGDLGARILASVPPQFQAQVLKFALHLAQAGPAERSQLQEFAVGL